MSIDDPMGWINSFVAFFQQHSYQHRNPLSWNSYLNWLFSQFARCPLCARVYAFGFILDMLWVYAIFIRCGIYRCIRINLIHSFIHWSANKREWNRNQIIKSTHIHLHLTNLCSIRFSYLNLSFNFLLIWMYYVYNWNSTHKYVNLSTANDWVQIIWLHCKWI